MSNLPVISITIDKDKPGGPNALLGQASAGEAWDPDTGVAAVGAGGLSLMALDLFSLQIVFQDTEDTDTDFLFDADCVISCSLAAVSELSEDDGVSELVRVTPFTRGSEYYSADVDLNIAAVLTALDDDDTIPCVLDIRVTRDTARLTYRVPVTLYRPALGDAVSSEAVVSTWANVAGAQMRQRADGLIEFYDFTKEAWVVPVLKNGVLEYQENG